MSDQSPLPAQSSWRQQYDVLTAFAFRPFFIVLPAYIAVTIILWSLFWSGAISLSFTGDPLVWHLYEMSFGIVSGGIVGFLLTVVPEFYEDTPPITGHTLAALVALWLVGRISFWGGEWLGVYVVALTNLPLLLWFVLLTAKPLLTDFRYKHTSLFVVVLAMFALQTVFFVAQAGWVTVDVLALLRFTVGLIMVLVLLVLRRVNTGAINNWLEQHGIEDKFLAAPPRYNIAILCILLFSATEFWLPNNAILGWLGLACAAAVLNLLNDFFLKEQPIIFRSWVFPLFLVLVLMACGFGLLGVDYLDDSFYGINHFRHFLTTGVIGLSFFIVMAIVGRVHTGKPLSRNRWLDVAVFILVAATLIRGLIPFAPAYTQWMYAASALLWAIPFLVYLWQFVCALSQPREDGVVG